MTLIFETVCGILLPFFGTSLGAAAVFAGRPKKSAAIETALFSFAAGVMAAAAVWSLLLPSIELSRGGALPAFFPAAVGFVSGEAFCLLIDRLLPEKAVEDGARFGGRQSAMLILTVTLHNLPEGMAVGVICAGLLEQSGAVTAQGAFVLSLGIALQNIPEGAIVSLPAAADGRSRGRAFFTGVLSGAVEPVGALLTLLLTSVVSAILPYMLSFAAGAMICVVTEELIPRAHTDERNARAGALLFTAGFALMMSLDVALG